MVYARPGNSIAIPGTTKKKKALPAIPNLPTPGAAAPRSVAPYTGLAAANMAPPIVPTYTDNSTLNRAAISGGPSAASVAAPSASGASSPTAASSSPTTQQRPASSTGSDLASGFASQYSPEMIDTIINQHPEILTQDVLKQMGMANSSYAGQLADEGGVAQLVSFILQSQGAPSGNNNTVNQMANYFKNRVTPGGSTPDTQFLVNAILNADPNSKIYNELGLGSASGSGSSSNPKVNADADAVNQMLYGTLNDQNRYTQQASQNYLAQQESNYINALAKGQTKATDYLQYLRGHSQLGNWF